LALSRAEIETSNICRGPSAENEEIEGFFNPQVKS
jgi:hypothetical protein